jgi:hypothetical protein
LISRIGRRPRQIKKNNQRTDDETRCCCNNHSMTGALLEYQRLRSIKGLAWPLVAILTPIIVACAVLGHFMFSYPCQDDYHAILEFSLHYQRLSDPWSRLTYIVAAQHVDYKLIFEHSLLVLQLHLLGHVNFTILVLIGDAFLFGILFAVWKMCFPQKEDIHTQLLLFAPVSLLLFSLNYSETLDWAMACLQNLPVVFFSMMALYFLFFGTRSSNGKVHGGLTPLRFWLACGFAVLAPLSSANGFLIAPIGLYLLFLRREVRRCLIWVLLFPPLFAAYIFRYHVVLPNMRVPLYTKPFFVLAVLGDTAPQRLIVLFGAFVLCVWIWSLRKKYFVDNPYAFAVSAWVVGTALMIAAGRGNYGLSAAYASRYKIYSDLFLIFCYSFVVTEIMRSAMPMPRRRLLYQAAICLALLYCARSDLAAWRLLTQRRADVNIGMAAWRQNPAINSPMFISDVVVQKDQAVTEDERS